MELGRAKVLIVGADKMFLEVSSALLTDNGYAFDVARTGAEAISRANIGFYNLALIDESLSDMSGLRLSHLLNNHVRMPKMRKVIVGEALVEDTGEFAGRDVDAFLAKPINPDQLLNVIDKQLLQQEEEQRVFDLVQQALWSTGPVRATREKV